MSTGYVSFREGIHLHLVVCVGEFLKENTPVQWILWDRSDGLFISSGSNKKSPIHFWVISFVFLFADFSSAPAQKEHTDHDDDCENP